MASKLDSAPFVVPTDGLIRGDDVPPQPRHELRARVEALEYALHDARALAEILVEHRAQLNGLYLKHRAALERVVGYLGGLQLGDQPLDVQRARAAIVHEIGLMLLPQCMINDGYADAARNMRGEGGSPVAGHKGGNHLASKGRR